MARSLARSLARLPQIIVNDRHDNFEDSVSIAFRQRSDIIKKSYIKEQIP